MKRLLALALTLLLSSCFDVREEVTVEADGSGQLTFDYVVPAEVVPMVGGESGIREQIENLLASEPKVRLQALDIFSEDKGARIHIEIVADSMLALKNLKETEAYAELPASSRNLAGTFDVEPDGLKVRVNRQIDIANALGLATIAIGQQEREQRQLEYIIHLPKAAEAHNADEVENDGHTLIWKRSLGEALSGPIQQSYTAPIPLPVWVIPAVVIVVMLIVLGLVSLIRRIRSRRLGEKRAPEHRRRAAPGPRP